MRVLSLLALAVPLVSTISSPARPPRRSSPGATSLSCRGRPTIDTDPTTFGIYLVDFVNWPPSYTPLTYDIETVSGAASVKAPCSIDHSWGYQLNAINGTNVYVIYSQTPKFYVSSGPCENPTTPEPTCAAATVTVTVSTTLSSTIIASSSITPAAIIPTTLSAAPSLESVLTRLAGAPQATVTP